MAACETGHSGKRGFTLVETLAALAIGSVIIVATAALVRGVALNFDRGVRGVGDSERLVLAIERLADDFSSARFVPQMNDDGPLGVAFNGESSKVTFVATAAAGRSREQTTVAEEVVSLELERDGNLGRLIRRRGAWAGPRTLLDEVTLQDPVVLLAGQFDVAIEYASKGADGALNWNRTWIRQAGLPRMVRLRIRNVSTGADLIPAVEFLVRSDGTPACAASNSATGCTSVMPVRRGEERTAQSQREGRRNER